MKKFRIPRKKKKILKRIMFLLLPGYHFSKKDEKDFKNFIKIRNETINCVSGMIHFNRKFDIQIEQNENDINRFDIKIRRV